MLRGRGTGGGETVDFGTIIGIDGREVLNSQTLRLP